jgi:hypothetical protein
MIILLFRLSVGLFCLHQLVEWQAPKFDTSDEIFFIRLCLLGLANNALIDKAKRFECPLILCNGPYLDTAQPTDYRLKVFFEEITAD